MCVCVHPCTIFGYFYVSRRLKCQLDFSFRYLWFIFFLQIRTCGNDAGQLVATRHTHSLEKRKKSMLLSPSLFLWIFLILFVCNVSLFFMFGGLTDAAPVTPPKKVSTLYLCAMCYLFVLYLHSTQSIYLSIYYTSLGRV